MIITNPSHSNSIRFAAKDSQATQEKARYQKTKANAQKINSEHLHTGGGLSPLEVANWHANRHKGERKVVKGVTLFLMSFLGFSLGVQEYSRQANKQIVQKTQQAIQTASPQELPSLQERLSLVDKQLIENERALTIIGFLFAPALLLVLGLKFSQEHRKMKKYLAQVKAMEGSLVKVIPQSDPVSQRLVGELNKRIDESAKQFAARYQELCTNNEEVRGHFNEIFGGPEELPTAEDIKRLAIYTVYHQLLQEQGVSGWEGHKPIQETTYAEKVYSVLKAGQILGNPFELIKDKPNAPFGEEFNELMLGHLTTMELKTAREVGQLKGLFEKQVEIERQISLARKALAVSSLSVADHQEKIQQISRIIEAFKGQQQKIEEALKRTEPSENPDPEINESLVLGINDTLHELMVQLNIAAKEQENQQKLDTAVASALAEIANAEKKTGATAQLRVSKP